MAELPDAYTGITLGTTQYAAAYATTMSERIQSVAFGECEKRAVDGGVHNVLVHTDEVEGLLRFDMDSGPLVDAQVGGEEAGGGGQLTHSVKHQSGFTSV